MGQTFSRNRSTVTPTLPSPPTPAVIAQSNVAAHPESTEGYTRDQHGGITSDLSPVPKRSRRASIQRSIMSVVHPRSARNRVESTTSNAGSQTSRRRWRLSKRFSKAPEEFDGAAPFPSDAIASESSHPSEDASMHPPPFPVSPASKGKEREAVSPSESDEVSHSAHPQQESPAAWSFLSDSSPGTGATASGSLTAHQDLPLPSLEARDSAGLLTEITVPTTEDEVVIAPSVEPLGSTETHSAGYAAGYEVPEISQNSNNIAQSPADPLQSAFQAEQDAHPTHNRQFPPPGTLVVVQGVVHTSDVSRSQPAIDNPSTRPSAVPHRRHRALSIPPTFSPQSERSSMRNRLSAILPRPSSMFVSPDSSTLSSSPLSASSDASPGSETMHASENMSAASSSAADAATASDSARSNQIASLSPSSIDVLGTLLSVAAAATAASLLTGSSEPIFSSGLPPAGSGTPGPPLYGLSNNSERPTSPTPTAGLGGFGPLGFPGFGFGAQADAPVPLPGQGQLPRDRMRHVWGNLRDRLGFRGPGFSGGRSGDADFESRVRPDGTPMDAREIMLAEMARAFNLGLGLNNGPIHDSHAPHEAEVSLPGDSASSTGEQPQPNNDSSVPSLPPPDSFERFLIDLQADLRTALSQDPVPSVASHAEGRNLQPPSEAQPSVLLQPPSEGGGVDSTNAAESQGVIAEGVIDHDMPALADLSDSEDEDGEFEDEGFDSGSDDLDAEHGEHMEPHATLEAHQHAPEGSPSSGGAGVIAGSTSRTERRPGGGINWWRLYRFPAIASPQGHGSLGSQNTSTNPSSHLSSSTATTPFSQSQASHSPPAMSNSSPPADSPVPVNLGMVVPVIVVGLQSVNGDSRPELAQGPGGDPNIFGSNNEEQEHLDFDDLGDAEAEGDLPSMGRGRPWHSRAAHALRNFRPGRRGASRHAQIEEAPGSRTFLIYVIGGYYPPDHHIITGAGNLDSFEALWDLAELLGQVKPPTVSKEEIDRSSLEIMKASNLKRYEELDKVASNCVDRCLICLDDYDPDDDLRILTCKHTFHKNCVDKWLQTGRNNCPACRSKGVGDVHTNSFAPTSAI